MGIAAIDCAQEENMPTCREYEVTGQYSGDFNTENSFSREKVQNQIVKTSPTQVMGYPTIKFFSPGTPAGNMGEERASRDKSVPAIKVLFKVHSISNKLQFVAFPERYGGIPERAAAEEGESRKGMA